MPLKDYFKILFEPFFNILKKRKKEFFYPTYSS